MFVLLIFCVLFIVIVGVFKLIFLGILVFNVFWEMKVKEVLEVVLLKLLNMGCIYIGWGVGILVLGFFICV